ncbi:MAG: hypothetical protein AAF297_02410 [Planctomycetota bacterium]
MPATRQNTLIHFEGWDTNFREGLKAPMWVRADAVVGVRHVVDNVCVLYLSNGQQVQANHNADEFVKLLHD